MKNVEQTPDPLSLQPNNLMTPIAAILFTSVFVVAGLAIILIFGELTTLTCQRVQPTQGSCQFVRSRLLRSGETTIPLNQLQSAKVDVTASSRRGNSYRVVLLTYGGEVPFTIASSSDAEGKQENVDKINAFIANPGKTSLRVQQDDRWFIYPFGGSFILLGGLGLFSFLHALRKG
jgi:hypothetical protein